MYSKKVVFITGAAGFIGFHLAKALEEQGHQVVGYDNFNSYYSPALKRCRAQILEKRGITIFEGDLTEQQRLLEIFQQFPFTHLVHLAAQAGLRYAQEDPKSYVKSNLEGFSSILELLRSFPHVKCVYASSSSVYGFNKGTPSKETDATDRPTNLYAATKKSNELMAYSYHHLFGISLIGLRYFTVYGPWGRPDMAYYTFADAISKDAPIRLYNNGNISRDFTYIDDIVSGTIQALNCDAGWEIFNLGNHHSEKVTSLIALLEEYLGKKAHIILEDSFPGDLLSSYALIDHAKEKLHFCPHVSLKEGIARFVEWYQEFHSKAEHGTLQAKLL